MFLRRVRGVLLSMLLWSVPWAAAATLFGAVVMLAGGFDGGVWVRPGWIPGGVLGFFAVTGGIVGAINGAAFAVVLMVAERRHGIEELTARRVGIWSALATTGTVLLVLGAPAVAGVCGVVSFGIGAAALRLARRAAPQPPSRIDA